MLIKQKQRRVLDRARMRTALATACLATLGGGFVGASPAEAYIHHKYLGNVVETPSEINEVGALALDPAEGSEPSRLWVSENNAGVFEFNAATGAKMGEVQQSSPPLTGDANGVAVGHGTGETQVYVTYSFGSNEVGVFSGSGTFLGRWNGSDTKAKTFGGLIGGVAVDNNPSTDVADTAHGRVYVADYGERVIDVFNPKPGGGEEYVTTITGPKAGEAFNAPFSHWDIAVDQVNGDVLVENTVEENRHTRHFVDVFEPTILDGYSLVGEITGTPNGEFSNYLSLTAPSTGEAYVAEDHTKVVDEFDLPGGGLVGRITAVELPGGSFGNKPKLSSVAADPVSHNEFVGVNNEGQQSFVARFAEGVVLPDVTTGTAVPTGVENGKIAISLTGTVNPLEGQTHEGASCAFVWGSSAAALSDTAQCSQTVLTGSSPVTVEAPVGEPLPPDTTYFYRLTALNTKGTNPGEEEGGRLEPPHEFTTPGPGLHGVSVSKVSSTSATLEAVLDPHGAPGSYRFEYGTESCVVAASSCVVSPSMAEPVGLGEGDQEVSRRVQGLAPGTTYHYRVVVTSDFKLSASEPVREYVFPSPERTFTTQGVSGASGLIDGRAWELVSPVDKNGALIVGLYQEWAEIQASARGGAITYVTRSPTSINGVQGYSKRNQVLSVRGSNGWRSCDIGTVEATAEGVPDYPQFLLFNSALSSAAVMQEGFDSTLLSEEASERTPYVAGLGGCESEPVFTPVATAKEPFADVTSGKRFGGSPNIQAVRFGAASPDLSHVVVDSTAQLTTTPTPAGSQEFYEWSADASPAERLQLISELPGGGAPSGGVLSDVEQGRGAVSSDGSRVFWGGYMRDTVAHETLSFGRESVFRFATSEISGPNRVSKAVFTGGNQLYECEIVEEAGKVKCNRTDITSPGADVVGNVSVSEDGSYVYFVANGVLGDGAEEGAKPGGCTVTTVIVLDTTCNLYVYHDGVTHFIATLSAEDEMDWGRNENQLGNEFASLWSSVSPNGRFFTFMSNRSLTGYDNRDATSGKPDQEVYLFDAVTGRLVCASCDPTGARPVGVEDNGEGGRLVFSKSETAGYSHRWYAASLPGWPEVGAFATALHQARYVSNTGRVFFNADGGLVPGDINGTEDVYEYEPEGGSCTPGSTGADVVFERARSYEVEGRSGEESAGCVGLISSGRSAQESAFMDASEDGSEVFFLTSEQLVSQDKDGSPDVYVARECTTVSPCLASPVGEVAPCETADSCRAAPTPQPAVFGTVSSATFTGMGNLVPSTGTTITKPTQRSLTRAQKLARALRACRGLRVRGKRLVCDKRAHKRYGTAASRRGRGR